MPNAAEAADTSNLTAPMSWTAVRTPPQPRSEQEWKSYTDECRKVSQWVASPGQESDLDEASSHKPDWARRGQSKTRCWVDPQGKKILVK